MPNITFSSPILPKDDTVYVKTGARNTILKFAKENKIALPFECEDGNCGSCLVHVTILGDKKAHAQHLTEKEKATLMAEGFLSKEQIKKIENNDMPPPYRLACQFFPLDEDVLIRFSGEPGVAA